VGLSTKIDETAILAAKRSRTRAVINQSFAQGWRLFDDRHAAADFIVGCQHRTMGTNIN
jgi:hypothetical protein